MWTSSSPTRSRFTVLCHSFCHSFIHQWKKEQVKENGQEHSGSILLLFYGLWCAVCVFLPALTVKSTTLVLILQVFALNESLWIKFLSQPVYWSWLAVPAASFAARLVFLSTSKSLTGWEWQFGAWRPVRHVLVFHVSHVIASVTERLIKHCTLPQSIWT